MRSVLVPMSLAFLVTTALLLLVFGIAVRLGDRATAILVTLLIMLAAAVVWAGIAMPVLRASFLLGRASRLRRRGDLDGCLGALLRARALLVRRGKAAGTVPPSRAWWYGLLSELIAGVHIEQGNAVAAVRELEAGIAVWAKDGALPPEHASKLDDMRAALERLREGTRTAPQPMMDTTVPGFRKRLVDALELARGGNREDALVALNAGLQEAIDANDRRWVSLFALNVGLLAEQGGDLAGAERVYQTALESNDADPKTQIALAELYNRSGRHTLARKHVERAFALATMSRDESLLELASALRKKYSEHSERE